MKKKLIALAVAGAFAAPVAAMADSGNVTIYGQVDASVDVTDNGTATSGTAGIRTNKVSSNGSRIGFKGSEDLGDGLAAVWQIENGISVDGTAGNSPTGSWNTRNTFVGLSSKTAGTVVLGRHDTPYKLATRGYDVFADTIADNRSIMGQGAAAFDGRQSDVIAYISPAMNGFTVAVAYVAGAETATTSNQNKGNAWSAMAVYGNGPFSAGLGYERHNIGDTGTGGIGNFTPLTAQNHNEHAWKLGAGYSFGSLDLALVYEKTADDLNNGAEFYGHRAYYVSGAYKFGNNAVKLAYTKANDLASVANTGANQWAIGVDHNFSKRTKVYALYTKLNNDSATAGNSTTSIGANGYALGGANTVSTGITAPVGVGADPSAWSFGIRHSF